MAKTPSAVGIPADGRSTRLAWAFHWFDVIWRSGAQVVGREERTARAAKLGCAALALTAIALFGIADVPAPLRFRMAAPVIGLTLALPLAMALWLCAISPRRGRVLANLAALALVAVGSASFARAYAGQVILAYFVPAILLLRAGDELSE